MCKALAGRLHRERLDSRVSTATDPIPNTDDPLRLPLSVARQERIDVSEQMDKAAKAVSDALELLGHRWTEHG